MMRKYKTFCVNCGRETRNIPNIKGRIRKPIDYCWRCISGMIEDEY